MQSQIETATVTNGSPNSSKESSLRPLTPDTKENGINGITNAQCKFLSDFLPILLFWKKLIILIFARFLFINDIEKMAGNSNSGTKSNSV